MADAATSLPQVPVGVSSAQSSSGGGELAERWAYQMMGEIVTTRIQEFLDLFQSCSASDPQITREDFFPKFLGRANKFADDCCQGVVGIILKSSRLSPVRGTSSSDLVKRVREAAFKPLDGILGRYYGIAKNLQVIYDNIRKVRDGLEAAAMEDQSLETTQNEVVEGNEQEWATDEELVRQHRNLLHAQSQAFAQMVQYLGKLNELPGVLLAYGYAKCFGGDVNYQLESEEVLASQAAIQNRLAVALETFVRIGGTAKQEVEEEQRNILMRIQMHKTDLMLDKVWEQKLEAKRTRAQKVKKIAAISLASLVALIFVVGIFIFCEQVISK